MPDWSRFNIQTSLKALRSFDPAVVNKELRRLHLRWFHLKEPKMRSILKDVGLDEVRLNMIKPIVDTCRECRAWERQGTSTLPSVSMPSSFNQEVECDLFFYKKYIVFHIVDRCIRWAAGQEIPNKERDTTTDAYHDCWYKIHGESKVLYCTTKPNHN